MTNYANHRVLVKIKSLNRLKDVYVHVENCKVMEKYKRRKKLYL